jgi:RNA polymerase sigma factor (sigma-70 family)
MDRELVFENWYRSEHPRLIGVLFVLCGEADVAQESADEAFARALARWPDVRAMASPGGWAYRVALNHLRRTLRRRRLEARLIPWRRIEALEVPILPEVWRAVATLPERQRTAIALRFLGDLPEADIAAAMGVQRGTVSSTLALARRRLAELLHDFDPEEARHG